MILNVNIHKLYCRNPFVVRSNFEEEYVNELNKKIEQVVIHL